MVTKVSSDKNQTDLDNVKKTEKVGKMVSFGNTENKHLFEIYLENKGFLGIGYFNGKYKNIPFMKRQKFEDKIRMINAFWSTQFDIYRLFLVIPMIIFLLTFCMSFSLFLINKNLVCYSGTIFFTAATFYCFMRFFVVRFFFIK
ncbi:hypothetical protein MHBO_003415, partial [Bonamia ostreae]